MSARASRRTKSRDGETVARARPRRLGGVAAERGWMVGLLALHAALAIWGTLRNSVTFDESFHVPAGFVFVTRGDPRISPVNPPLVKAVMALPLVLAGARPPSSASIASLNQGQVGESFMRNNADRFHALFVMARLVVVALSLALGWLIWRFARRLHGPPGARLALAFYVFAPEALAHAGVATMEIATALGLLATVYCFRGFLISGRLGWWVATALAVGALTLTRFASVMAVPILASLLAIAAYRRRVRHPLKAWLGFAALLPATLVMLQIGYLGHSRFLPLDDIAFSSRAFQSLQRLAPWLRLPLPDAYLAGLDWQAYESQREFIGTFVLGAVREGRVWWYFPFALLLKWSLGFLAAIALRVARAIVPGGPRRDLVAWLPAVLLLGIGVAFVTLTVGVRYVFPVLPFACLWLGGLAPRLGRASTGARRWVLAGTLCAGLQAGEALTAAPWYLSFFNAAAGGRGDRLLNDSNVDWGQGLIALREELARRNIHPVLLAYHGSVDPAIYGMDYVPYFGGSPDPRCEWAAISSYYFVGLRQRMMTSRGASEPVQIDFRPLWSARPEAKPAGCMYLYRLPRAAPATP